MRVTMQDVADRAGVDKATVSRVLRGDHRISEKTKIKVMESVRALDYRLDRNARNLSTKSSGLAGVVVRDLTEPWAGAFVAGLERALSNSGYDVILKSTDGAAVRAGLALSKAACTLSAHGDARLRIRQDLYILIEFFQCIFIVQQNLCLYPVLCELYSCIKGPRKVICNDQRPCHILPPLLFFLL